MTLDAMVETQHNTRIALNCNNIVRHTDVISNKWVDVQFIFDATDHRLRHAYLFWHMIASFFIKKTTQKCAASKEATEEYRAYLLCCSFLCLLISLSLSIFHSLILLDFIHDTQLNSIFDDPKHVWHQLRPLRSLTSNKVCMLASIKIILISFFRSFYFQITKSIEMSWNEKCLRNKSFEDEHLLEWCGILPRFQSTPDVSIHLKWRVWERDRQTEKWNWWSYVTILRYGY